jgi:hypothetical protein
MNPAWRQREPEIARATQIIMAELPVLQDELLPIRDVGHATWVNESYEEGHRGEALDYRVVDWEKFEGRSSSVCVGEHATVKADGVGSIVNRSASSATRWLNGIKKSGWPFRPPLKLIRENESIIYFDGLILPEAHEFHTFRTYVELSHRLRGVVPDAQAMARLSGDKIISQSHLYSVISRLRRYLSDSALGLKPATLRTAATDLIPYVTPKNVRGKGYFIERPNLIRIR